MYIGIFVRNHKIQRPAIEIKQLWGKKAKIVPILSRVQP